MFTLASILKHTRVPPELGMLIVSYQDDRDQKYRMANKLKPTFVSRLWAKNKQLWKTPTELCLQDTPRKECYIELYEQKLLCIYYSGGCNVLKTNKYGYCKNCFYVVSNMAKECVEDRLHQNEILEQLHPRQQLLVLNYMKEV